jgi:Response regulator receiver domain
VDDHRGVLDTVSGLLADDFDVVGVATDGSQALQAAHQVTPDAIVLDVGMPGLDGFQTAEGATSRLTVFGNMSALLSADGNAKGVIALESLWGRLTNELPFLTLCGYATSCFHDGVPDLWSAVCAEHTALSHTRDV